jgi:hypothetical protein
MDDPGLDRWRHAGEQAKSDERLAEEYATLVSALSTDQLVGLLVAGCREAIRRGAMLETAQRVAAAVDPILVESHADAGD